MKKTKIKNLIEKSRRHQELIAALVAGVMIVLALCLQKPLPQVTPIVFCSAYVIGGYAKAKAGLLETITSKKLNVELLMILAAIGSALIGYWLEGALLIVIFALSGALETYALNKSQQAMSALLAMQPHEAWLLDEQKTVTRVQITELVVGDKILVKPGEQIPVDGNVRLGKSVVDEAALSGEAQGVGKSYGDSVFAGTFNRQATLTIEMTTLPEQSLFQKIIDLVREAQSKKTNSEQFIDRFEGVYVKIVLFAVVLMMVLPPLLGGWTWQVATYRAMVLLVVASPCALVASITPALLAVMSNGAKHGVLFKGGDQIERLARITTIAFDKTGTLTKGQPIVTRCYVAPTENVREALAIVAGMEAQTTHPLAAAVMDYCKTKAIELAQVDSIIDHPGLGISTTVADTTYLVGKGAFMNKAALTSFRRIKGEVDSETVGTVIYMQRGTEVIVELTVNDTVRAESHRAINQLTNLGIHTVMLTGDNEQTARQIAAETKVEKVVANCLPAEKVEAITQLQQAGEAVAMIGDGINDAPALATASLGIAMGEGSDIAIETADIVLMKNDLLKLVSAVKLSRRASRIIKQNIMFSLSVIVLLIASNTLQWINLPFGVIGHEGSTILVILNSLRLLRH
ncbi:heavy metal translocating P-type ATPase [Brochothrix campestris]|uniref:Probable cadmium-transporting ATPase n=1 Tax=Brochothrix campestris FSL F6-1037 TaxID=1265861 RepID=W7CWM1_9LIST|nr:heavy metal translocating P-type ATPase [Brochothrix campestris]EUJ40176.1 cadmium-transporting ATPase [Brochothrix campestris FSL F6-1037]